MFIKYITQLQHHFARLFYIQLVMSIYSLLIIVFWGIPFCPLSFLGNLLFNPILVLFLGLCTLLFFTELCFIPNGYIIYTLDLLSSWWMYALHLGSTNAYNLSFAKPSYLLVATIACAAFFIIVQTNSYFKKNILLLLVLCAGFWLMAQNHRTGSITELACTQGHISILATETEITIVDPGYLGRYISAPSYVEYTLMPAIVAQYGTQTIDHLILLQPSQMLFQAITKLLEIGTVKHIYIPIWQGTCSPKMLRAFMKMKELATTKKCIIHRLSQAEYLIMTSPKATIEIHQLNNTIKSADISYEAYATIGAIDNQPFTFYPAKYTKQTSK